MLFRSTLWDELIIPSAGGARIKNKTVGTVPGVWPDTRDCPRCLDKPSAIMYITYYVTRHIADYSNGFCVLRKEVKL